MKTSLGLARDALTADGVRVLTGHKALRCERDGDQKVLVVEHQGPGKTSPLTSCCAPSAAQRA